jgi:hypothetical protein
MMYHFSKSMLSMLWIGLIATLLATSGFLGVAQTSKGTLVGVVRDASGAVISNADITVANEQTTETRQVKSNAQGEYRIDAITAGSYSIHADAAGFQTVEVKGLKVNPSVITSYDAVLTVGGASTTVEVQANSNTINTDNGQLSSTLGNTELANLPIFSLNPIELVATLPGVQLVNAQLNLGGVGGNYEQIEVNGARPRANNFMMDGQDINDVGIGGQAFQPQVPDMFQSETALTNSASAEYGRSGGAVVNLITKSGTNTFHGSVFELYQGSGLNSLDGQTRRGIVHGTPPEGYVPPTKARFDQHNYGFTVGGPILKNKLFAFGGSQWSRFYGTSQSAPIELPDAGGYATLTSIGGPEVALLQGLLNSGSYLKEYTNVGVGETINAGPQNGCPAGGCLVTTAMFERPPVAQQEPDTQYIVRVDFNPSQKDTFSGRFLHDNSNFTPDLGLNSSGLPGFDGQVGGPSALSIGTWTHIFRPTLLNEFRVSSTRINFLFAATPETVANPLSKTYNLNFTDVNIPVLGISQNIPQGRKENFYQFQDTISWTIGKQSLRMGVDVGRILETDLVAQNALGELNIAKGNGLSGLGNFLSDQLGPSGSATITFGPTRFDPHIWRSGYFVQDDIKLTPELVVNLGVRYDYLTDPSNSLPFPAIDVNNPFAPINTVFKMQTDKANWGPRAGFAYSPHRFGRFADKTVIHAGFGIFYDTDFSNIPVNSAQAAPNATSTTLISTQGSGLGDALNLLSTIQPGPVNPQSSVQSAAKDLSNPRTYQWNFGFERELPAQLKLTINYVGSRGRKLYANQQYNYFDSDTGDRLNPDRGAINARANSAASQYDSVQTEVSRQFSHGLFFRGVYTFGKNLDNGSEVFTTFASPTSYPANLAPNGRAQEWGPSVFNYPNFFSVTYGWTPVGLHSSHQATNMILGAVTRHWTVSGVTQLQSGPPSTVNISGLDTNGDGSAFNDRPLLTNKKAPLDSTAIDAIYVDADAPGTYYDLKQLDSTGAEVIVDPSTQHWTIPFGPEFLHQESGRNSFKNRGTTVWNMAVQKQIPLRFEGAALQLRAEASNLFNHNDVNPLDVNLLEVGTSNFLNAANARATTQRSVRFWAKFNF